MKRAVVAGILWIYRPGFVHVAKYRGWNVRIRRVPARSWRLHVDRGGASIAFGHQFYPTMSAARSAAVRMIDEKED